MPTTKKVKAQMEQTIELGDEEEGSENKPAKSIRKEPGKGLTDKKEYESALKDLLLRLGSLAPDDLKQLTFMSLKIRDPLAKGMAYYDSTIPTIEAQCNELLDWYIEKCEKDIKRCEEYIQSLVGKPPVIPVMTVLRKKTWVDKIFGSPKVRVLPSLEAYEATTHLEELNKTLIDLNVMKTETIKVDTNKMYFKTWAYNYLLNCRSQSGDDNLLKMMVMLADGQIVNKSDSGGLDGSKVFLR
jgi:hypothetical protein